MKNGYSENESGYTRYDMVMKEKLPADPDQLRFSLAALVLYKDIRYDALIRDINTLFYLLGNEQPDRFGIIDLYGSIVRRLLNAASGLKGYIIEKILFTENPFSRVTDFEGAGCLSGAMEAAVKNDLAHLQRLASLRPEWIKDIILRQFSGDEVMRQEVMKLPLWTDIVNAAALCPAVDVVNCPYIDGIGVHM